LTFGIVFTLLQVTRSDAAPSQSVVVPSPTPAPGSFGADSLSARLRSDRSVVGVPILGSEPLLRDLQPGDRLDVLASFAVPEDSRSVTAVVVRGATVLRQAITTDPLLLEVAAPDALVLAHLVLGGTHLGYAVWPAAGSPPESRALDERTARELLGLSPLRTAIATPITASVAPTPIAIAVPPGSGFLYQVQAGDSWDSVAAIFGISASELRRWNEAPADAGIIPGALLFIPRQS
jgi:hypothetical protein